MDHPPDQKVGVQLYPPPPWIYACAADLIEGWNRWQRVINYFTLKANFL